MEQLAEFGHLTAGKPKQNRRLQITIAFIVAIVALAMTAGLALGQTSRPSGSLVLVDSAGTEHVVTSVGPIVPGISAERTPDGWLLVGDGSYHPTRAVYSKFLSAGVTGDAPLLWPESKRANGVTWSIVDDPGQRPYTPYHDIIPGSDAAWIIRGGDWIYLPTDDRFLRNRPELAQLLLGALPLIVDMDLLSTPRLEQFVALHGDAQASANAQGAARDLAWFVRNWKARTGEIQPRGWLSMAPRWGDGFSNGHYNELLWQAIAWARNPTDANYAFGLRSALYFATVGHVHSGVHKGRQHYEKGAVLPGDYFAPDGSKMWHSGLAAWAWVSGHPVLVRALEEHLDAVVAMTPQQAWDGQWGARRGANWLDDLITAGLLRPADARYRQRIDAAITYYLSLRHPTTQWWVNRGAPEVSSPWMAAKLVRVLWRGLDFLGDQGPRRGEVVATGKAIIRDGMTTSAGRPRVLYRFHDVPGKNGPVTAADADTGDHGLLGFMFPVLRIVASQDGLYAPLRDAVEVEIVERAGWKYGMPAPPKLSDIGAEWSPGGLGGWPKAMREYLMGAVR